MMAGSPSWRRSWVAVTAPPAGALRLQDGRGNRRRVTVVGGCGRPSRRHRPGQAEQTVARPASVRTCIKIRWTWRAGRRPAPQEGGSTATGWPGGAERLHRQVFDKSLMTELSREAIPATHRSASSYSQAGTPSGSGRSWKVLFAWRP